MQKFREINILHTEIILFWHTMRQHEKFTLTKDISSNQLYSNEVTFTKFLPKIRENEFL